MINLLKYLLYAITIGISDANKISFISYGDWGESNIHQKMVANAIDNYTKTYNSSFNLVLGDNFYESGISSIFDPLWKTNYENIYT